MDFIVKRIHIGDKTYVEGDKRTADPREVQHLIDKGILVPATEELKNKDAGKAPKNKSE